MIVRISNLIRHYSDGFEMPDSLPIDEKTNLMKGRNNNILVGLSWDCSGDKYRIETCKISYGKTPLSVSLLPDASGLICFEPVYNKPDNSYILDTYGNERYRLTVPWELTPYEVPPEAKRWFRGPSTHPDGQYGVTAWIEYAGDFYFELDYHKGQFLWGKEIRF